MMKPCLAIVITLSALTAHLGAQAELVAVKAGKVITMTGTNLENAVILIENGLIKEISTDVKPAWNAKVIDASDRVVMPTWVLAHTSGGMSGANENLANVPYLTVDDAIDPSSGFFTDCLRNGIGTLHVIPGHATLIGGQSMVVRPHGRTVEDMVVKSRAGLKLSLQASGGSRMGQIRKLRRAFQDVQDHIKDFARRKQEFEQEKAAGATEKEFEEKPDPKKQPVIDMLEGKLAGYLYVPSAAEMAEALRLASQNKFPLVLVLGARCHMASSLLKRHGKPVILDPSFDYRETDPETDEETHICAAAELAKQNIEFALSVNASGYGSSYRGGSGSTSPQRYPWWQMATCIKHGVDRKTALEAFTTVPAKILGMEKEVGTIEAGKIANLQILTGDPLKATTWVETVLLEGEVVYERSKDRKLKHLFGEGAR
ncbi:MAG: amidohydrolase family protein [Planctomycetota bacterium]|jgi:imidazolonepropionase-like amidohydrolase|nr:amidohydrolase family protein [Planctomycetota bacterium]